MLNAYPTNDCRILCEHSAVLAPPYCSAISRGTTPSLESFPQYQLLETNRRRISRIFDFHIEYRKTPTFGQADALSRLTAKQVAHSEKEDIIIANRCSEAEDALIKHVSILPVSFKQIRNATKFDKVIQQVLMFVKSSTWPNKIHRGEPLWQYWNRRSEFLSINECLFLSDKIVIPTSLSHNVLKVCYRVWLTIYVTYTLFTKRN